MLKINLVPEVKQEQIKLKKINLLSTTSAIVVGSIIGGIILLLLSFNLYRIASIKSVESQTGKINEELVAYKDLEESVTTLETNLSDIKTILAGGPKWTQFLDELEKVTPNDIQITSFSLSGTKISLALVGSDVKSIDRFIRSFSTYKVNDSSLFSNVEVKGYTTNEKNEVTFQATLDFNKGLIW